MAQCRLVALAGAAINLALNNRLLASLPADLRHELLGAAEFVELGAGLRLESPLHAYFPTSGVVSLLAPGGGFSAIEIALASPHGLFGPALQRPGAVYELAGQVTEAGAAWRIRSALLERIASQNIPLHDLLQRHGQVLLVQTARMVACVGAHSTEQRAAHWLLAHAEASRASDMIVTHAALAALLGARRASVTGVLRAFGDNGAVVLGRGHLVITDRPWLEQVACICYQANCDTYRRLMGFAGAAPAPRAPGARGAPMTRA